jgi:hypothetical protein
LWLHQACDQHRYPFLENSHANLLHLAKTAARGGNKQIFGAKSQATIFNPPYGGRMTNLFNLSLDKT